MREKPTGQDVEALAVTLCTTQAEMVGHAAPGAPCDYHRRHASAILASDWYAERIVGAVRPQCNCDPGPEGQHREWCRVK